MDKNTRILINPTGRFVVGGPHGDAGVTGRKIIVDTYGGAAPHGGGAFSGKDPTKVDRSACYMARYVAKNVVAAGLAERCMVQLAYAIGVAEPVSVLVDTFGTGSVPDEQDQRPRARDFKLTPRGIIETLDLRRPIYKKTAAFGHFGRTEPEFTWERTDKAEALRADAGPLSPVTDAGLALRIRPGPTRRHAQEDSDDGGHRGRRCRFVGGRVAVPRRCRQPASRPRPSSGAPSPARSTSTARCPTARARGPRLLPLPREPGLRFVVFTDHGDGTRQPEPPRYASGVLCIDAVEISTNTGHYVALGLGAAPYRLGGEAIGGRRRRSSPGRLRHRRAPGLARGRRWPGATGRVEADGVEWLNADSEWRNDRGRALAGRCSATLSRPAAALAAMLDRETSRSTDGTASPAGAGWRRSRRSTHTAVQAIEGGGWTPGPSAPAFVRGSLQLLLHAGDSSHTLVGQRSSGCARSPGGLARWTDLHDARRRGVSGVARFQGRARRPNGTDGGAPPRRRIPRSSRRGRPWPIKAPC